MKAFKAFLFAIVTNWVTLMSSILGIVFTIVSLLVEAKYLETIFFWIGFFGILLACFLAFKHVYEEAGATVSLEVDCNRSRIHIKDSKSHPPKVIGGRTFVVVDCIEIDV
jgi:hypothetical protein